MTTETKHRFLNHVLNALLLIITALMVVAVLFVGPRVEVILSPVVSAFTIDEVWQENGHTYMKGSMFKDRGECIPQSLVMTASGNINDPYAKIILIDTDLEDISRGVDKIESRPAGSQYWGPWEIFSPEPPIGPLVRIYVTHRCHFLWNTEQLIYVGDTATFFPLYTGED